MPKNIEIGPLKDKKCTLVVALSLLVTMRCSWRVCSSSSRILLELSNLRVMGLFNEKLFNSADMCSINALECGYNV